MKSKQLKSTIVVIIVIVILLLLLLLLGLEQGIVPWKKDSDQKRCMKCRREFNVRRRRHHCRLCGDVICKRCSNFYPFTEACKSTAPALLWAPLGMCTGCPPSQL